MNSNKINNNTFHKKRVHTQEPEMSTFGLPRKKFISEESFANEMAAMSLYPRINENYQVDNFYQPQQQQQQMQQMQQMQQQHNKNVVRIDDINEFLSDEGQEDTANDSMYMDTNGRPIFDNDANGLPIEVRPGESKPRIPDFVLDSSRAIDPRDRLAVENMLKYVSTPRNAHIEVLNSPTTHYTPTSMDID